MFEAHMSAPIVSVITTQNRGQTPEEVAARCVEKIVEVSENAHPALRDQAIAYRDTVQQVITIYMKEAIKSDRTTIYNAIKEAGYPELAENIRRL
tara:strand:+ start:761 stop:1045 length:285 start_codon:yes stop_codon:yes gene_type:complete